MYASFIIFYLPTFCIYTLLSKLTSFLEYQTPTSGKISISSFIFVSKLNHKVLPVPSATSKRLDFLFINSFPGSHILQLGLETTLVHYTCRTLPLRNVLFNHFPPNSLSEVFWFLFLLAQLNKCKMYFKALLQYSPALPSQSLSEDLWYSTQLGLSPNSIYMHSMYTFHKN